MIPWKLAFGVVLVLASPLAYAESAKSTVEKIVRVPLPGDSTKKEAGESLSPADVKKLFDQANVESRTISETSEPIDLKKTTTEDGTKLTGGGVTIK